MIPLRAVLVDMNSGLRLWPLAALKYPQVAYSVTCHTARRDAGRHTVSVCIDIACVLFAIVPFWSPGRVFILPLRIRSTDPVIIVSTHPGSRIWRLPSLLSPVKGAVSFALFVLYFFYSPSIFLLCSTSLRLPSSASFTRELPSLCAHAPVFDLLSVLFRAAGPLPTRR